MPQRRNGHHCHPLGLPRRDQRIGRGIAIASHGLPTASHVRLVEAPDSYRRTADFVASVKAAVQDMQAQGIKPAALLVDSIFSSDGVFSPANGELAAAAQCVRDAGGLYIADEVQPGFSRTGGQRWGLPVNQ